MFPVLFLVVVNVTFPADQLNLVNSVSSVKISHVPFSTVLFVGCLFGTK